MKLSFVPTVFIYLVSFFVFSINCQAQKKDSIIATFGTFKACKNLVKGTYYLVSTAPIKIPEDSTLPIPEPKKFYEGSFFIGRPLYYDGLQILTKDFEVILVDDNMKEVDKLYDRLGVCGTVPHYKHEVLENEVAFILTKDEYFYDNNNEIPPLPYDTISKQKADSVTFAFGSKTVSYTENYGIGQVFYSSPDIALFYKGKRVGIVGKNKNAKYAKVELRGSTLVFKKCGKWGIVDLHKKTKYKNIKPFNYFLAAVEQPNGKKGYIDTNGNEYFK